MKKIVIVGAGSAGLIAASLIKGCWNNRVEVEVIYDSRAKNIGVGESTTPFLTGLFCQLTGTSSEEILRECGGSVKLGIDFKNWRPNESYFHGFAELGGIDEGENVLSSTVYSLLEKKYNGGVLYNKKSTKVPDRDFRRYNHALHIDTKNFSDFLFKRLTNSHKVKFTDAVVDKVRVDPECKNIQHIELEDGRRVEADFFIDASGFNTVLFKHLNPQWIDTSWYLPLDRAIPQQVPYEFEEVPSYTVCEATDVGWIWKIPIGNRWGTGFLYSSKFTSDEEAREKYDVWLKNEFGTGLDTDRIIRYKPGYYKEAWIGNCLAIGLASGFAEPLEATSIHGIIKQVYDFNAYNPAFNNLELSRKNYNAVNEDLWADTCEFIAFHYVTDREDSEFWRYMKTHRTEWCKDIIEKCDKEFLDATAFGNGPVSSRKRSQWGLDNYIQVARGLKLFKYESIKNYLMYQTEPREAYELAKKQHEFLEMNRKKIKWVSQKGVLDNLDPKKAGWRMHHTEKRGTGVVPFGKEFQLKNLNND